MCSHNTVEHKPGAAYHVQQAIKRKAYADSDFGRGAMPWITAT